MAANLALTLTVGLSGKTATGAITGGTGLGYAITDATGLFFRDNATSYYIVPNGASVVGSTITITFPTPFEAGVTILFQSDNTANLVDSGGNTLANANQFVGTNSSTATASLTDILTNLSKFNLQGAIGVANTSLVESNDNLGPQLNVTDNTGYSMEWVLNVTSGTVSVDILGYFNFSNSPFTWSVDGGVVQTGGHNVGFEYLPIAASLGTGKHIFRNNCPFNYYTKGVRITGTGTASIITVACPVAIFADNVANTTLASQVSPVKRWSTQKYSGNFINNNHPGFQFVASVNATGIDCVSYTGASGNVTSFGVAIDQATPASISSFTLLTDISDSNLNNTYQVHKVAAGMTAGAHKVELLDNGTGGFVCLRAYNGSATSASSSIGDGTISVADITNIADGDWLIFDHLQNEEVIKVASHSGTGPYTLTLSANLAKNHVSGAAVRNLTPANTPTISAATAPTFIKSLLNTGDSKDHAEAISTTGTFPPAGYLGYDIRASGIFIACRELGIEYLGGATQGWTSVNIVADAAASSYASNKITDFYDEHGTNDFGSNVSLNTFQANQQLIINQFKAASPGGATIRIQMVYTPTNVVTNGNGDSKADFNARQLLAIANTAASGFTIVQVDIAAALDKTPSSADIPDDVHDSIAGTTSAGTGGQNKKAAALMLLLNSPSPTIRIPSIPSIPSIN